jgi:hypothetical protein
MKVQVICTYGIAMMKLRFARVSQLLGFGKGGVGFRLGYLLLAK